MIMGFIKGAFFGIAAYALIQYITKKDIITHRSILDDLIDKTPEYLDTVSEYVTVIKDEFIETKQSF